MKDTDIYGKTEKQPLVVRVSDTDFERDVLEKLSRLETKMEMLAGGAQPGRMKAAEDRLMQLERSDIRRSVYERLINAAIATAISLGIALSRHLGIK